MSTNIPTPGSDDNDSFHLSSTPTPLNQVPRSLSYNSGWSAASTPQHHHQGTSYFPAGASAPNPPRSGPPPILVRRASSASKNRFRSTSLTSSHHTSRSRENILGEEDEEGEEANELSDDEDDTGYLSSSMTRRGKAAAVDGEDVEEGQGSEDGDDDPITIKDRQSLINVQHPFGLPIWKPALYKKSRSVTRNADQALHMGPSAQAQRHLSIGNIFWTLAFGWWLAVICIAISAVLYIVPNGGSRYASLIYGLGWYLVWPFGKYVEGDPAISTPEGSDDEDEDEHAHEEYNGSDGNNTVRAPSPWSTAAEPASSNLRGISISEEPTITPDNLHPQSISTDSDNIACERSPLLKRAKSTAYKSYGANIPSPSSSSSDLSNFGKESFWEALLGKICFWLAVVTIIAPLMLIVCTICWALVVTIPMAKLNWALIKHLFQHPTSIRFCAAPPSIIMPANDPEGAHESESASASTAATPAVAIKHPRLSPGQIAPSGSPKSTVLLCVYNACGLQYYKYTIGGVNILFVNLLPVVFFVIFDGLVLLRIVERLESEGKHVPKLLEAVASRGLIFVLSLLSVIPLSYFIGMAVASISAQSSIGMGAVINATFGSIIEIILYGIALTQKKGLLVEGSIVGSLLAGVLLMPGASMCSSALRRKEQRFNAKSAGVTSVMLIMAIIGALAPTMFYQTFGNFQLVCTGCPNGPFNDPYICDRCYYKHPDPTTDPFYQSTVKTMMYFCASILLLSYLIGLWFSLRTHATQIWQNPQPLLTSVDVPNHRLSLYQKLAHPGAHRPNPLRRKPSHAATHSAPRTSAGSEGTDAPTETSALLDRPVSPSNTRRVSYAPTQPPYSPVLETVNRTVKDSGQVPQTMSTDDFTRAVAVATVSALRHTQTQVHSAKSRVSAVDDGSHGGHDAPNWSRQTSASVLLGCTALYAIIAEILVDVVEVVIEDLHIPEKFLGITLFALVPNTTEFMNAMSFALNGNIALSMEIGSAYALQVCLLQIPAMVAFSAWYNPKAIGEIADTFTLIFPRWDVICLILSMFLMTYTYIEARSNYHRGSILILSYVVLVSGFYFAPDQAADVDVFSQTLHEFPRMTLTQAFWWYTKGFWA